MSCCIFIWSSRFISSIDRFICNNDENPSGAAFVSFGLSLGCRCGVVGLLRSMLLCLGGVVVEIGGICCISQL